MKKNPVITCLLKDRLVVYNDPGRFDVCRGCPLKQAAMAKHPNK